MFDRDFAERWRSLPEFGLTEREPQRCPFAQRYRAWAEELCGPLRAQAGIVAINQAKLHLTDQYFSWRAVVPKAHRDRLTCPDGACLLSQFTEFYEKLLALELALEPPPLSLPPPPKRQRKVKAVPPPAPDIYFADEEEDA